MSVSPVAPSGRLGREMRPHWAVVAGFGLLLLALALQMRATDADFWWHLRTGQWILEEGRIPRTDPFSYTAYGQPWIAHSWLADIALYLLYRHAPFLLHPLRALLQVATFGLLLRMAWQRWPRLLPCLGLVLAAFFASAGLWLTRPNSLSLAFFVGVLYLWHLYKSRGKNRLWLLPPLFALWANLHSGYIFGLLLLACLWVGEALAGRFWNDAFPLERRRWWRLGLYLAFSAIAVLLNPYGPALLVYPFRYFLGGFTLHTHYVGEWLPPNFQEPAGLLFALLILLLLAGLAWRRVGVAPAETLAILGFTLLGLRSVRAVGVAVPLLTYGITGVLGWGVAARSGVGRHGAWPRPSRWGFWLWYGGIGALLLILLVGIGAEFAAWGSKEGFVSEAGYPQAAVEYLRKEARGGRLFNSYNWGGYLIWQLKERPVFIDGRADLYGDTLFADYLRVWHVEPSWAEVLNRWEVEWVLCEKGAPLATLLVSSPSWTVVYEDSTAVLYHRGP
ncbi:MAG: hypothetical protein ACP5SI_08830 [Chloroflexia bacterium]